MLPSESIVFASTAWEDDLPVLNPQIANHPLCELIEAIYKFHLTEDTQSYLLRLLSNNKTEIEAAKRPTVEQPDSITNPLFLEITH